ncbi:MAG TPA: VOC family protein, partial [Acidiferrobacterales bacterium]|nr:VOC family protein [Acidiferrobacterales bacterium]
EGRSAETWIDFDFYGHQITAHLQPSEAHRAKTNAVDGDDVPVRHFGLILHWDAWHSFERRLRSRGVRFLIEPHIRFKGQVGEQATMFFLDPSGNAIEIKSFKDRGQVFAV